MKHCRSCGQILGDRITTCPACGSRLTAGIAGVDDYRLEKVLHEGHSSFVFRARKEGHEKPVTIRLFTDESGVDEAIAGRLDQELTVLSRLPPDLFVQHYAIRQSRSGLWYRVSEWVDAENWGTIFLSGRLNDQRRMATLFYNVASALDNLEQHGHVMPFLILDDILLPRNNTQNNARSLAVKINFKLSRFLNPKATHHGPMLRKLLAIHPDMVNQRGLDNRTGIWSLGKIFAELLAADPNLTRYSSRLDDIRGLDPELAVLVKVMLSDDPDLRPQTMAEVAASLERILERIPSKPLHAPEPDQQPPARKKIRLWGTAMALALVILAAAAGGFYFGPGTDRPGSSPMDFLESHSRSIAFVMVEYWLTADDNIIYENKVEGTAFLADKEGYLLTNRHVACPWLEDPALFAARQKAVDQAVTLGHRMFLWFEGERAFNRLPGLKGPRELADAYILSTAFQSGGRGNLRIAGVPRQAASRNKGLHAPFSHDFAVLHIDDLPKDLKPLPLEASQAPEQIRRLSSVIIMGFPLGSKTQDDRINASITTGHVRRTSRELIQVDSSIYKGNSGGPAVNDQGRVIGIASGVITERPMSQLPLFTPLSDFGLVLPIAAPRRFIASLKSGQPKWDGHLDFALGQRIDQLMALAINRNFDEAAALADRFLESGQDPTLIFTAGLLHFCRNDMAAGRRLFERLLSMEEENTASRLMVYIMEWLAGQNEGSALTRPLFTMDWRHPDAFSGYLARVLSRGRPMDPNFLDYENPAEKTWRRFMAGLILEKEGQTARATALYREVLLASGANDQLFLMALARLGETGEDPDFHEQALAARTAAKERYAKAVALISIFEAPESDVDLKTDAVQRLLELSPFNRTIFARMAFFHAGRGEWDKAREYIRDYFSKPGRETRLSLGLGLLKGQLLGLSGHRQAARDSFSGFKDQTRDPWYKTVTAQLIEQTSPDTKEQKLIRAAGTPVRRLILHTALGLRAERENDLTRAAHHYREALGTYLEGWYEYDLARDRLMALRGAGGG